MEVEEYDRLQAARCRESVVPLPENLGGQSHDRENRRLQDEQSERLVVAKSGLRTTKKRIKIGKQDDQSRERLQFHHREEASQVRGGF